MKDWLGREWPDRADGMCPGSGGAILDHRPSEPWGGPAGPNEDIGQCSVCLTPGGVLRPDGETWGDHVADCSLPRRHRGHCVGGGNGHEPAAVIRG